MFTEWTSSVNNGNPPAPGTITVAFSGASPAGPITDTFSSPGWLNEGSSNSIFLYNYTQVDQILDPGFVLTGFDLSIGATTIPAADGIQILADICTNDTTNCIHTDPNWGQLIYTNSGGAVSESFCYNGNAAIACTSGGGSGATALTFDPSLNVTSIFVTNWVIISVNDTQTVSLNQFSNDYFEGTTSPVPEPGTFALLSAGLAAAALWRRSRKK